MDINSVKSILTLRYDYTQMPILPKIKWTDLEKKQDFSPDEITHQITCNLKNQIPDNYSKPISISLSGGVDSTLVLCILKQNPLVILLRGLKNGS